MSTHSDLAIARFQEGYNCAQSVFSVYAESFGMESAQAYRLTAGLGGGMGRLQEVCGAVTAAFMLAGLKHGKTKPNDTYAHELTYSVVRDLATRFEAIHGSIICRTLVGCDLRTSEGIQQFKATGLSTSVCARCVETACLLVEEILKPSNCR